MTSEATGERAPASAKVTPQVVALAAGALALVVLGRATSDQFLTRTNLTNTVQAVALLGIVAVGVSFVTYVGHYADLSVPSIMACSGILCITTLPLGLAPSLVIGVAAGLAIGAANGLVIGYLRANPIIWTLSTGSVAGGVIRWAYSGTQIYPDAQSTAGRAFLGLYGAQLGGTVPVVVLILVALVAGGHLLMTQTTFGAQARLTGSSYQAARMTGINVRGVVCGAFLLSALTAALGGILLASLNKVGAAYIGRGYDFMAVTAVVIGGVTLAGGRGGVPGVLGGVLVIGLVRNILTLMGVDTFRQDVVQGLVFILVVGVNAYLLRRGGRDAA